MSVVDRVLASILVRIADVDAINMLFREPRVTATIIGVIIATAAGILGCFLLLRGLALTSDAISHTVLLGIVVAFMIMSGWLGIEPDLSSPWLIIGAAAAGVATVVLTEAVERTGLVRLDAALGLVFPLLFAVAVIFVSRYVDDVHMDEDAVMVGEIGVAWANTEAICLSGCEQIVVTAESPQAELVRRCVNCTELGITPRDERAEFRTVCVNCGEYSPVRAWRAGLIDQEPVTVFLPRAIPTSLVMLLLTLAFVLALYKELKLSSFDPELAASLGRRPILLNYALMVLVSLVAVAAFDAVGSILVIAFFIIPAATAYLLTHRLALMLLLSAVVGSAGAIWGYGLARGEILGLIRLPEDWTTSISASMVLVMFGLFLLALVFAPSRGLVVGFVRRLRQRNQFRDMVLLGHVVHHAGTPEAVDELGVTTLHRHVGWSSSLAGVATERLRRRGWVTIDAGMLAPTAAGKQALASFHGVAAPKS